MLEAAFKGRESIVIGYSPELDDTPEMGKLMSSYNLPDVF